MNIPYIKERPLEYYEGQEDYFGRFPRQSLDFLWYVPGFIFNEDHTYTTSFII